MGADDWWPKSQPRHKTHLGDFYLDKFEVTNTRYKAFVNATGRVAPTHWTGGKIPAGKENHPVVYVSVRSSALTRWSWRTTP